MECIIDGKLLGSITGDIVGAIKVTEGKIGQALYTDGATQYVSFGNHRDKCVSNLQLCSDGLSIALWLKTEDMGEYGQYYISNGGKTYQSHGIALAIQNGRLGA